MTDVTVPASRSQRDRVDCEIPTSLDSAMALIAFGPTNRDSNFVFSDSE